MCITKNVNPGNRRKVGGTKHRTSPPLQKVGGTCPPSTHGSTPMFLSNDEISHFDLMNIPVDSDTGYIIECDLTYPESLHQLHSDYPLAPEHLTVSPDMLSNFCNNSKASSWKPTQKLVPNLQNKTKYVCHYRNLQFYVKHGLIVTKIHRIISFCQKQWLKPWIDYCTENVK